MRNIEKLFKALADSNRLRILKMLEVRPLCVCEITEVLGITQPSVSRHLAVLKDANLVEDSKEGQWVIYSLPKSADQTVMYVLKGLQGWIAKDNQVLGDKEKATKTTRSQLCSK
jgi:ArsR family transcriptional regulator